MEVVLSNGIQSKEKIIEVIKSSKFNVYVAMAFFTDKDIADVLIESCTRGVKVIVILSSDSNNNLIYDRLSSSCEVYNYFIKGKGIMHHKFCIVDQKILMHGSYNYTYNAINNNEESLNITDSNSLIKQYNLIFHELLNQVKNNNMDINSTNISNGDLNYADKFYTELKGHVQHILDFDKEKSIAEGRELSLQTNYAESGFVNKLDSILSEVQTQINKDDHTKELIKIRMKTSLDNIIGLNNNSLDRNIELLNQKTDSTIAINTEKIETDKSRRNEKVEELNSINLSKDIKKNDISNLEDQVNNLDREILTEPFWTSQGYFGVFVLILLTTYLSFYIGSAFWKIFFENNEIKKLTMAGVLPDTPSIFDANAISKLFLKKGFFFGMLGSIFFMFPLFLTILKLFPIIPKYVALIGKLVGLVVIDIIVSLLISQHTFDLNNLLIGESAKWSVSDALSTADFWLIFILGSVPFFVTSLLIEQLWFSYKNSQPKYVNKEKNVLRKQLTQSILAKKSELLNINNQIDFLNNEIIERMDVIRGLEDKLQIIKEDAVRKINDFKLENEDRIFRLTEIYNGFLSKVDSGTVILEDVIIGRIIAFKEGFFEPITSTYLPEIAKEKISSLENCYENWKKQNFK